LNGRTILVASCMLNGLMKHLPRPDSYRGSFSLLVACLLTASCFLQVNAYAGKAKPLLEKGWQALIKDQDAIASEYFNAAYELAKSEHNTADKAEALLNMGICSYSLSHARGLRYAFRALAVFGQLEASDPKTASDGRSRCLQLISTIYSRQGNYRQAAAMSREALNGLSPGDTTGSRGLMYNSLGVAYARMNRPDSAEYYHRLALKDHLQGYNTTYLPGSLLYVAAIELKRGNKTKSLHYYERSLFIADSTRNQQAMVSALLGLGEWYMAAHDEAEAERNYRRAESIALGLNDRMFYVKVLQHWYDLRKQQGNYREALHYQQEMTAVRDAIVSAEKQAILQQLEVQFNVSEKERKLRMVQKEKNNALLLNYLLWSVLGFSVVLFSGIVLFMKRINRRNQQLLQTQRELTQIRNEQQRLKEQQLQQELTYKEDQLGAMTLQMMQRNEWITGLKTRVEQGDLNSGAAIGKLLERELNRDQEWSDFNVQFERINTNFYQRLKQEYPEISPNDLKLCALIKLNLSIKEMSAILNISPDSVKTARYRLRKKFQLNGEDNLTDFILSLS
jgi:DNA-binding CsgD family transcriptional regulator